MNASTITAMTKSGVEVAVRTVGEIIMGNQKLVKTTLCKSGSEAYKLFIKEGDEFVPQYMLVKNFGEEGAKHCATIFSGGKPKYLINGLDAFFAKITKEQFGGLNIKEFLIEFIREGGNVKKIEHIAASGISQNPSPLPFFGGGALNQFKSLMPACQENQKYLDIVNKMLKSVQKS